MFKNSSLYNPRRNAEGTIAEKCGVKSDAQNGYTEKLKDHFKNALTNLEYITIS